MIPKAFIDQWRNTAPWASDHQVEELQVDPVAVARDLDCELCAVPDPLGVGEEGLEAASVG